MDKLEDMIKDSTKENIIKFLKCIKEEYNSVPKDKKSEYLEELKDLLFYILFNVEKIQKEKLGNKANSFMICIQDYWIMICWYLVTIDNKSFIENIDKIIYMCEDEWITNDCYNLDDDVISDLMDISEEKFNLMSILENSKSSFYYFNIPFKNKYAECNTRVISNFVYIFQLYGVEQESYPLQMSFCYLLGLSLYFYILEVKPELINEFREKFNITDEDCSSAFGDNFALALLQFTDYDIEEIDLRLKEKCTRYFEKLTSSLRVTKKISKNKMCPCGSGKKYKDCCEKKDMEWVTVNGEVNKQFSMNDITVKSLKKLKNEFSKIFGRNPYSYERIFEVLGFNNRIYENLFSKMADKNLPLDKQYAVLKTGMILSEHNYNQIPDLDIEEWGEAIEEFNNKNSIKIYNNKSIFEVVRETNIKLNGLEQSIKNIDYVMNEYLNKFPVNFDFSNLLIENQKDFSMVCARKIIIDTNILLSAFEHQSVEEATNITRIIFENLIQTEILLKNRKLFEEKIIPLALLEKGILEYKKNSEGKISKNILINSKTGEEYNVKINIRDFSLKSENYKKIYDDIFDGLSSFIHLNINKIPRYFNVPNPLTEVQEYKTICLIGLFLLNQCIFEIKSNIKLDGLMLRDMEYIYNKNATYINKCLKMFLILEPNNDLYDYIIKIQKACSKTINRNNKIKLN